MGLVTARTEIVDALDTIAGLFVHDHMPTSSVSFRLWLCA